MPHMDQCGGRGALGLVVVAGSFLQPSFAHCLTLVIFSMLLGGRLCPQCNQGLSTPWCNAYSGLLIGDRIM